MSERVLTIKFETTLRKENVIITENGNTIEKPDTVRTVTITEEFTEGEIEDAVYELDFLIDRFDKSDNSATYGYLIEKQDEIEEMLSEEWLLNNKHLSIESFNLQVSSTWDLLERTLLWYTRHGTEYHQLLLQLLYEDPDWLVNGDGFAKSMLSEQLSDIESAKPYITTIDDVLEYSVEN